MKEEEERIFDEKESRAKNRKIQFETVYLN